VPSVVMCCARAAVLGSYLAGVAGVQFFAYVGPGADGDLLASSSSTQGHEAASASTYLLQLQLRLRRPLPAAAAATPRSLIHREYFEYFHSLLIIHTSDYNRCAPPRRD
jgi:hypothetical protein